MKIVMVLAKTGAFFCALERITGDFVIEITLITPRA
jgi:hypothetical protein